MSVWAQRVAYRRLRVSLVAGTTLVLGACAGLPPRSAPPDLSAMAPLSSASTATPAALAPAWPAREWWHAFGDPTLDALIARALSQSPDLAAAGARINAARAAVGGSAAATRLQLAAGGSATETRLSDNGLFPPKLLGFNWYSQFDVGISASYDFDLWGRQRAAVSAAVDTQRAAEADRQAAALYIASTVAAEYYGWQSEAARGALAEQEHAAAEQREQISAARVAADIERRDTQQSAELTLLATDERLSNTRTATQQHRVALAALLVSTPEQLPELPVVNWPQLSAGLPANASIDLIARRPEIVASRWRVENAARHVDMARSDFLPNLSLKALLGLSSREIGKLVDTGSGDPNFGAALHLPLFDGGALRAGYARSQADLDVAVADYRAAIVKAAQELNTQLAVRDGWQRQQELRARELDAAAQLLAAAEQRTGAGLNDQRPALDARQQWLQARSAQLQTQYARLCAELALIRALGGGYQLETNP